MRIPARAALRAEMHCLAHDGLQVLTVQQWHDGVSDLRSWLRLVRGGQVRQDTLFVGARGQQELAGHWVRLATHYAPTGLTEDQMWAKLLEQTGMEQDQCQHQGCSGRLPVARTVCPDCRRDIRNVARGSMTRAHGRGDIFMAPRKPAS